MSFYDLDMNNKSITNLTSVVGSNQLIVTYGNAQSTTAGRLYFLDASNNWNLATNSNSVGFQLAIANGSSLLDGMILQGTITNSAYSGFTTGGALYVSTTSGLLTNTAPSSGIRVLGNSLGSNQIYFCPSNILSMPTGISGYGIASGASSGGGFTQTTISDPSNGFQYSLLKYTDSSTTQNQSMTVSTAGLFEVFILGGGGGGGNFNTQGSCGAGGAGQLIKQTLYLEAGAYTICVGNGGSVGQNNGNAVRGRSSWLCPTTPNSPKLVASGGGAGFCSTTSTSAGNYNSYFRSLQYAASPSLGGGAAPYNDAGDIQSSYGQLIKITNIIANIGFGQSTNQNNAGGLITSNFDGGGGYNDGGNSATGGGAGAAGAGGDVTQQGGQNMRGGSAGLGIIDGFSGVNLGYAGGGAGGHSTNRDHNVTTTTGVGQMAVIQVFSTSGTTLTVTNVNIGTILVGMRVTGWIPNWVGNGNQTTPNNPYIQLPTSEIFITSQISGTTGGNGVYTLNTNGNLGTITPSAGQSFFLFLSRYGGGLGGRSAANTNGEFIVGTSGAPNSGGGGGGSGNASWNGGLGGAGGSGVVMVRYRI
jgi:hypothetical protein